MNYEEIKNMIKKADAIIIGAGFGLSEAGGIDYGELSFKKNFPKLVEKYDMKDIITSSYYSFETDEERWSYWSKHINYIYNRKPLDVYKKLYNILKDKEYFVITTNTDGQFLKAGFEPSRVLEAFGSLSKMQCAVGCHNKLYDVTSLVEKMIPYKDNMVIPKSLIPKCPICEGKMELNLRKDAFFVQDENYKKQNENYQRFIHYNKDKSVLLLELGVSLKNPEIIRYPFEYLTYNLRGTNLVRVNDKYSWTPYEIRMKSIRVSDDINDFLDNVGK